MIGKQPAGTGPPAANSSRPAGASHAWPGESFKINVRAGPSSKARTPISIGPKSDIQFFIRDNIYEGHEEFTSDNTKFFSTTEFQETNSDGSTGMKQEVRTVDQPFAAPRVTTVPAKDLLNLVLPTVGASLPKRDPVDTRLVGHVRDLAGKIIDSQTEVGGWPELKADKVPMDSDNDGIPDEWETKHHLNPHETSDASKIGEDGYSNIEEYLNGK